MHYPVCILVMAHQFPEQLENLLLKLQHPQVLLAVHIDKKSGSLYDRLTNWPGIHLVKNRVDVKWAHISQVRAVFSSCAELKSNDISYGHLLVISGQDYPLHGMDALIEFLGKHPSKTFLSFLPLTREGWAGARKRYRYHYYVRMEKLWRGLMMLTGIRRQFPFGLQPFGGSQWINITQAHMDYVMSFCEEHVSLMNFMETVRFPEEMLFQTLLLNSHYKDQCVNNDLRFVKWIEGKSNPEVLDTRYSQEMQEANDKFFARKFDWKQSARLIQMLDETNI